MTLPTVIRPDSVRFQKDFQNCMSRFWVMRSNSAPRNSGSRTYFPDVRRERAAIPGRGRMILSMNTSEKATAGTSINIMTSKPDKDEKKKKKDSPKPDCCLPYVSPYETMLMTTVWRNGRRAGENCEKKQWAVNDKSFGFKYLKLNQNLL